MPPGITPPLVISYSASSVPILQLALSGQGLSEQQLNDFGTNFIRQQLATVPGASVPWPYGGKQRQIMIDLRPAAAAGAGALTGRYRERGERAEPDPAGGDVEDRAVRIRRGSEREPEDRRGAERSAGEGQPTATRFTFTT